VYDGPENSFDQAIRVRVDRFNNVYVAGRSGELFENWGAYTLIKYTQTSAVSVDEKEPKIPQDYYLSQNYPNPFNPTTTIRYTISKSDFTTLTVYNLAGQEITTLVNEKKPAGEYEVQFNANDLPSGVYFYRLQVGDPSTGSGPGFTETKKLVLLK
jgi:hypothetical protein